MSESGAFSCVEQQEWCLGHWLETSCDDCVGVAQSDWLWAEDNGFQSWWTDFVEGGAWSFNTKTGWEWSLSGWGLTKTGAQNITKNDLIDFLGIEVDGLKSSFDGETTQLSGAEVGDFT